jgi:hypothetical protein
MDLGANDGWRDHDNERESHVEEAPDAADESVLHVVIAVMMGKKPLLIRCLLVEGIG